MVDPALASHQHLSEEEVDELMDDVQLSSPTSSSCQQTIAAVERVLTKLAPIAASKTATWRTKLEEIKQKVSGTRRVVVAVIGASGAGKSSLINALLGEDIVPTSGMRSCTATPIEISYHDKAGVIAASVEFITKESWVKEIGQLLTSLAHADGVIARLGEDGKEAWDRVHAIYPLLTTQFLLASSPEAIIDSNMDVRKKLETTVTLESPLSSKFLDELSNALRLKRTPSDEYPLDLWPLVSRVVVHTCTPVLGNGVVLVDLPGVQDSNTARAAIYKRYIRDSNHVCVVANVKRAATDKVAQDLLGDAFKSQLLMDGQYNSQNLSFIVTCTDDVDTTEISNDLNLEWTGPWLRLRNAYLKADERACNLRAKFEALKGRDRTSGSTFSFRHRGGDIEISEQTSSGGKRRLSSFTSPSVKMLKKSNGRTRPPPNLSMSQKNTLRLERQLRSAEDQSADRLRDCMRYCSEARSQWTINQIKEHFSDGLMDLMDDPDDFDDTGVKEVFAVSAREYFRLRHSSQPGSMHNRAVALFDTYEETGIPKVIQFFQSLGTMAQASLTTTGYEDLFAIVKKIALWLSAAKTCASSDRQRLRSVWHETVIFMDDGTKTIGLKASMTFILRQVAKAKATQMDTALERVLIPALHAAAEKAEDDIADCIQELGNAIKYWSTLRAIYRRDGVWKTHDWNAEAVSLLSRHFAAKFVFLRLTRTMLKLGRWNLVLNRYGNKKDSAATLSSISDVLRQLKRGAPENVATLVSAQTETALQLAETLVLRHIEQVLAVDPSELR
ncbi:hypothetical protein EXIGLDRAFT_372054 [Exidia glandulosa HHB12029]|uniref:Dynamin N-terminal domain-containing protein n=1 Tax=Exidia glandulosa HHB12029 TaxID=1314781 RepID=A0A165PW84_EXIGL|nr:hypothetical protein EXIGLDRAFT_372054 [Exidia glandulosa HHB12029]